MIHDHVIAYYIFVSSIYHIKPTLDKNKRRNR